MNIQSFKYRMHGNSDMITLSNKENVMKKVILVAESGADIPADIVEQEGIYIVPMHVSFDQETKDDGSFPPSDIVTYFEKHLKIPKTSGSTIVDFDYIFDRIHEEHPDAKILYLAYSSVTTCSYGCAKIAMGNRPYITAIDTKLYSIGQGQIVVRVAEYLKQNPECEIDEAVQVSNDLISRGHMSFMPKTLAFLVAGGRVSNAKALLAGVLLLHPSIEAKDGHLVAGKNYRGKMSRVIYKMMDDFIQANQIEQQEIWCCTCVGFDENLKPEIDDYLHNKGIQLVRWSQCGGVITTHGGPGAFGIAGFTQK